ncbi:hypothetical protein Q4543_03915 [Salipiger sp. 1_MG-2023]|uniref:hypothetical protein n=1 Tax=Salipiger sp. 1_MG-2023 TaxID=3062665 RepID=UPI0026E12DA5|nr:hypothetical protein [Salipiger sp. 1_MG-2023]MDO6584656.1 hypothetical protein [Salipiger sp. 1_MG-2023]
MPQHVSAAGNGTLAAQRSTVLRHRVQTGQRRSCGFPMRPELRQKPLSHLDHLRPLGG